MFQSHSEHVKVILTISKSLPKVGFLKRKEKHLELIFKCEISSWLLLTFSAISGFVSFVVIWTCLSGIRFIQLREDYKSAKLAARLSSLWPSSSWYNLKSELFTCKSRTLASVKLRVLIICPDSLAVLVESWKFVHSFNWWTDKLRQ